ncbi:MAG: glycosyl hydrolase family 18 protein [Bacillota bacterium]|nr:glycosyl hydrolase family 18 protein [Bacillota bacterium]
MEKRTIIINGYVYPFADRGVFQAWMPDLTMISTFSYGLDAEGNLLPLDDRELTYIARSEGVGSLMVLTAYTEESGFDSERASLLFNNAEIQDKYIAQILENLREKKMRGVDFDFEYVFAEDREKYVELVSRTAEILNREGYIVTAALAPKTSTDQPGVLYQGHDYYGMGQAANLVLLMTYEWGYTYGPPMAVAPINQVRRVVEYGLTQIEARKILLGVPNYGYDWTLPFVRGVTRARKLSHREAYQLAVEQGVPISYNPEIGAPTFRYTDIDGLEHEVWFEDERSLRAKFELVNEYGLAGISFWNIMSYHYETDVLINEFFNVYKDPNVIPVNP